MVVTVVGCSGGASGGGFGEHGGGCPLVADELGDAAPDTCCVPSGCSQRPRPPGPQPSQQGESGAISKQTSGSPVLRPIFP